MDLFGIYSFCLGAIFGSYSNVAIYRYLSGESVVWPGSKCPSCQTPLRWYHNIPIFSWVALKGKCQFCSKPISKQYWIVELFLGILFYLAYLKVGWTWTLVEYFIFLTGLVIVSGIDLKSYLLPDIYTWPGIFIGLIGAYLNPEREFISALLGVLFGGGFLWSLAWMYKKWRGEDGLGGGDIKLIAWIGALLGWEAIPFVMILSSLLGTLAGLLTMRSSQKGFKTMIPFGPHLALGSVIYLLFGDYFSRKYAEILGSLLF